MGVVWLVFLVTAATLFVLAIVALRWHGDMAPAFRAAGRYLLVLAVITAAFPAVLGRLGPALWVALYSTVVLACAALATRAALVRARRT